MPQMNPTIVTGPRDGSSYPDPTLPRPNVPHAAMERILAVPKLVGAKRHPRERVYHSRISNLRLQLTNPQDRVDPGTGLLIRGRPVFAQFRNGEFRVSPDDRRFDEAEGALFPFEKLIARLESFKSYGLGGDFWDAEVRQAEMTEAAVENVVAQASADPAMARMVLSRLQDLQNVEGWPGAGSNPASPSGPPTEKIKK